MTYKPGGPVPAPRLPYIEERLADLEFQNRRLEGRIQILEANLREALDDIAALRRPRDLRYLPGKLRGRS